MEIIAIFLLIIALMVFAKKALKLTLVKLFLWLGAIIILIGFIWLATLPPSNGVGTGAGLEGLLFIVPGLFFVLLAGLIKLILFIRQKTLIKDESNLL